MNQEFKGVASAAAPTTKQRLFNRYFTAILIDLTVLNLFDEYSQHVVVASFTISLLTAILLQALLKLTLAFEHRVAQYFDAKSGAGAKFLRLFCAWLILFGSKFVMLGAIDLAFGDQMHFGGPLHGVVIFIAVVIAMLVAEEGILRLYHWLGRTPAPGEDATDKKAPGS